MKDARKTHLSRLVSWAALLCIGLVLSIGASSYQANASIIAHIACGDTELADGGWVCNCTPGENGCVKHIAEDENQGDLVDLNHHHHAEVPSGMVAEPHTAVAMLSWMDATPLAEQTAVLHGIDPSQADQPPKI